MSERYLQIVLYVCLHLWVRGMKGTKFFLDSNILIFSLNCLPLEMLSQGETQQDEEMP